MVDVDLEELYNIKRNIEERIERYIGDDRNFHTGDMGYQDLLGDLSEIEQEIEKRENNENNENIMNNLMSFDQFSINEKKRKNIK